MIVARQWPRPEMPYTACIAMPAKGGPRRGPAAKKSKSTGVAEGSGCEHEMLNGIGVWNRGFIFALNRSQFVGNELL